MQTRPHRPGGFPLRPGLHGHVRHVRPGGRDGKHRHDPRGARPRRDAARHGRLLWQRAQRTSDRPGVARAAEPGTPLGEIRRAARPGWRLGPYDARPAALKNFLAYSLVRLGVDHIDIYRPSRLDPQVPIEDTIGAIAGLVQAGYVRYIGLSEVGVETIRRAHAVHPITDLQIEYSLISRGPEREIFPVLAELGIAVTAYDVLSRGLLSGSKPAGPADFRAHLPRCTGDSAGRNERALAVLNQLAGEKGATPSQLAIAWALAKGSSIVPVVGARQRTQLTESLAALTLTLTPAEVARIGSALPESSVTGTRYFAQQMAQLDSEK